MTNFGSRILKIAFFIDSEATVKEEIVRSVLYKMFFLCVCSSRVAVVIMDFSSERYGDFLDLRKLKPFFKHTSVCVGEPS